MGNLSLEITEEELRQEFRVFGEVVAVTIMNDEYIGGGQSQESISPKLLSQSPHNQNLGDFPQYPTFLLLDPFYSGAGVSL